MISLLVNLTKAFVVGGAICMIGEFLELKTKLTPARILVGYIVLGVLLSAVGLYGPLVDFAGAGATIPLTGFGHALTTGVKKSVQEIGVLGAFTGGLTNTAAGIAAAVFFGTLAALLFKPHPKE
ncbi:MAG: SpoVA/SpoVAEb family sporulation membrane protein [Clostridiales bacterium]|nr:SpoVA/SpoVAEb family sporulation membrane protein [Clostridiales bacterium]